MGCGHSKINNYRKKMRDKALLKKYGQPTTEDHTEDKAEDAEEIRRHRIVNDNEDLEIPLARPLALNHIDSFGPIKATKQLSASQTDFFRMLDEKIENGPDYDSSSETEKALEEARLTALLKDWETASAGSRSLPSTPKRHDADKWRPTPRRPHPAARIPEEPHTRPIVHQYYPYYPPNHCNQKPIAQQTPEYGGYTLLTNPAIQQQSRQFSPPLMMKNIPQNMHNAQQHIPRYATASELIQQQIYNQKLQYQQAIEFQQLKHAREQQLLKQQQQNMQHIQQNRTYENIVRIPYNQNADGHYYELA